MEMYDWYKNQRIMMSPTNLEDSRYNLDSEWGTFCARDSLQLLDPELLLADKWDVLIVLVKL